jgi:site-specific DNA-methyltransferase (adenine-specific)
MMGWKNKLIYGDNLRVLRDSVEDESIDLIYFDPPFNSAANYNVLFREASGEQSAAQSARASETQRRRQADNEKGQGKK